MGDIRRVIGTRLRKSIRRAVLPCLEALFQIVCMLLLTSIFLDSSSSAQHMNSPAAPCRNVVVTVDMANCFYRASKKADLDLNHTYATVREALRRKQSGGEDDLQNLLSVQRLWLQFRDASCKAEGALYRGGTAAPVAYLACLEELTRQRTADIKTTYGWVIIKFGNETENGGRK